MLYSPLHPICVTVALRSHVCRVAAGANAKHAVCGPGGRREKFGHAARVHSGAADTVDRESAPWTESPAAGPGRETLHTRETLHSSHIQTNSDEKPQEASAR